jgi:hypothetical protein
MRSRVGAWNQAKPGNHMICRLFIREAGEGENGPSGVVCTSGRRLGALM